MLDLVAANGGGRVGTTEIEALAFPSRKADRDFPEWLTRAGRVGASPSLALRTWDHVLSYDAPLTPPGISVRTLVLHNVDSIHPDTAIRDVVESLENATLASVPGADAYPIAGDVDPLIVEIARGGRVVKFTGDGALCVMPSVSSGLDAAFELQRSLTPSELRIRTGIHVGDIDERGADISGIAVNAAARIMSHAGADEVVASTAAVQAAMGSGHEFESLGEHELKGIAASGASDFRHGGSDHLVNRNRGVNPECLGPAVSPTRHMVDEFGRGIRRVVRRRQPVGYALPSDGRIDCAFDLDDFGPRLLGGDAHSAPVRLAGPCGIEHNAPTRSKNDLCLPAQLIAASRMKGVAAPASKAAPTLRWPGPPSTGHARRASRKRELSSMA